MVKLQKQWLQIQQNLASPPILIRVSSYSEFIKLQEHTAELSEWSLHKLSMDTLIELVRPASFISSSSRVQNQIDQYEQKRNALIKDLTKKASLQFQNYFKFSVSDPIHLETLQTHAEEYLSKKIHSVVAKLDQSETLYLKLLTQIFKKYFNKLPAHQKAEILFQVSLKPLNIGDMDLLLVAIQNSGPALQKLIQVVGRNKEVPKEYQKIFQQLESEVKPDSWKVIQEELARQNIDIRHLTYFEHKPLGVGTMAQNHRIQYVNKKSQKVTSVLRILKSGIHEKLLMDYEILKAVTAEIDIDPEFKMYDLPSLSSLVEDNHRTITEEFNTTKTIQQQQEAAKVYNQTRTIQFNSQKNLLKVSVPWASSFQGSNMMEQELIIGRKPHKEFSQYNDIYPDLYKVVAETLAEIWLEEVLFGTGFFHADLHQGNILAQVKDSTIHVALLDFGMVGKLNKKQQESSIMLYSATQLENSQVMAKHFLLLKDRTQNVLITEQELANRIDQKLKDNTINNKIFSMEEWTVWILNQGIKLDYEFLKLNRAITTLKGLLIDSNSEKSLIDIAESLGIKHSVKMGLLLSKETGLRTKDYAGLLKLALIPKAKGPQTCKKLLGAPK